ncbi:MAG: class I SAM-dependent methyltransferase [Flavobacteriales bacterium]|jgi:2-polyprenyl-3-methyl-5-hydroxy-6-metoxy-1,4-benzoquinol methylase|nr:class I SAM-dependent methyltransferase [Flavobacteriales bacterium]MBK8707777.1 class I SAM-dependent methyltransferase [Flavobacteriales bacterium]
MNFEEVATNITKGEDGIYYSRSNSKISYPEEGNDNFMQVEENSFWFTHRNNIIAGSVKQHSPDTTFFDIGGGNGFVAKRLQDEGIQTILVEPGKTGAFNAKKRGIENVLCSTLDDAEFLDQSIDSIGLFDVVEHIEDDRSFLKNIHKYMKNDGFVYITVPAFNFLWSDEDDDAGHFRRYSRAQMENLLKDLGFKIVLSTYIFSILPIPVFLFRSLPSRLGFYKNSNELEKHQSAHEQRKGILNSIMQRIWSWELSRVTKNKRVPIGGSCFIIARKIPTNESRR